MVHVAVNDVVVRFEICDPLAATITPLSDVATRLRPLAKFLPETTTVCGVDRAISGSGDSVKSVATGVGDGATASVKRFDTVASGFVTENVYVPPGNIVKIASKDVDVKLVICEPLTIDVEPVPSA